jgi:transposase
MLPFSISLEGNMARPKAADLCDLAARAESDLEGLDKDKAVQKLRAIVSVSTHPYETVADILHVTAQTLCNWVSAYRERGLEGLRAKPKKPKPSKLSPEQKAAVLSWLEAGETADGDPIHWTLGALRLAIAGKFGVSLGINTIWVWLRKDGWKPKVPRPRHYSADAAAQDEFKKKLPS